MYRSARYSSLVSYKARARCCHFYRHRGSPARSTVVAKQDSSPTSHPRSIPEILFTLPRLQSYGSSYHMVTSRFPAQTLRYFSRGCDEDIDKKDTPLANAEETKVEIEENKTEDATPACDVPSKSEARAKDCGQPLGSIDIQGPREKEEASQSQEAPKEATEAKPAEKERKKVTPKVNPLKAKFKKMLISRDKISDTFENFPYYLNEHTRDLLIESAAAQLHHKQTKFGKTLRTSSRLVLLMGPSGSEIYQEKLVRALAHHLQTSLLILDSDVLTTQHCKQEAHDSPSDFGGENGAEGREIWSISTTDDEDGVDEEEPTSKKGISAAKSFSQALGQIVKYRDKPASPKVAVHVSKSDDQEDEESEDEPQSDGAKIGDHVRFIGSKATKGGKKRLSPKVGQQGVVISVSDTFPQKIHVKFEVTGSKKASASSKENTSFVFICDVKELEKVDAKCPERVPWMAPIEALSGLGQHPGGVIVYFPDLQKWMVTAVSRDERNFFLHTLSNVLDSSKGPAIFICGRRKESANTTTGSSGQWHPLKSLLSSLRGPAFRRARTQLKAGESDLRGTEEVFEIFKNIVPILPPQDHEGLRQWKEQLDRDKKATLSRNNALEIEKVLSANVMICKEVASFDFSDLQLSEKQAQKIVGWARNIYLNSSEAQQKGKTLRLPRESLELALSRFRSVEKSTSDKLNDVKALAENDYESELASSVVRAKDIGVSFDQIGALEDVKTTLKELIILPLKRPELFSKGNLRKPCKGVLLFGPPGTGKTLLAKAVATEAGANFMSINTSSITCKFFGESEKLAKSLFTLARKLEPTIIFIDEVDGILRARGDASEHEASRRVRNELMAAWDGLQSKERERILVLATTNRPFDLDDAVVRRLPRRIFIDLPDATNREKILHVLLAEEDLSNDFDYKALAIQTEGFSGSDLKNLCVAAAYRPIQEFLDNEKKGKLDGTTLRDGQVSLRPLCLEDFIQAKAKVGMSVAYDASSMVQLRQWNEQYGEGGSRVKSPFGFIK